MSSPADPIQQIPTTWIEWNNRARQRYAEGDFSGALTAFQQCLEPNYECPHRASILSNSIACQLQLQQTDDAIRNSKTLINLNASMGYIRLASAYSQNGQSNLACQTLQTALRHDPQHPTARSMLRNEMRTSNNIQYTLEEPEDTPSPNKGIMERLTTLYQAISRDHWFIPMGLVVVVVVVLVLYYAFRGGTRPGTLGNYDPENNAYTAYRQWQASQQRPYYSTDSPQQRNGSGGNTGYHHQGGDGSLFGIILIGGVVYVMHLNGFSVWEILMAANMMQGRRRLGMRGFQPRRRHFGR